MTTTIRAIYEEGVLKLRQLLPLPPQSEVLVTVELPRDAQQSQPVTAVVRWPDISARLHALYGRSVLPENAVLAARRDERF